MDNNNQVPKYDRLRGGLEGIALFAKPSTIRNVETITGRAETFMVETGRHSELGDFVFIELTDEFGVIRICLPPKVANVVASQRDALSARRRSLSAKRIMDERLANGFDPGKALREYRKGKKKAK
jgi:hypothetical protein